MNQPHPGSLEYWAGQQSDAPALIEGERVVTWKAWNDQADRLAISGVNMSLQIPYAVSGDACGLSPVCREAERLIDSGVVVVAAAGNLGWQETVVGGLRSHLVIQGNGATVGAGDYSTVTLAEAKRPPRRRQSR